MVLRFLGTGAAFNPALGNTGAFFTRGEDLYLIDCGEQAFMKLMRADLFRQYPGRIVVLLTHLHADHCGSLGTLCLYAAEILKRPMLLVHPNAEVRTLLRLMGATEDQYTLLPSLDGAGFSATPIPRRHAAMDAYAYMRADEEGTIYYSGDTSELPEDLLDALHAGRIHHAYQEASYFATDPDPQPPHLLFSEALRRIEPALRLKFTLMHFNVDFRAIAKQEGFACAQMDPIFAS